MSSVNKAIILGRMGNDPELRYLPNGTATCSMSVATSFKHRDKVNGELVETTEWHRIVAFERNAEVIGQYTAKGSLIYIEGTLRTRKYTDKANVERSITEIRCDRVQLLGGGKDRSDSPAPARAPSPTPAPAGATAGSGFDDLDNDIPF